jgi:hypothetical protein
MSVAQCEGCGEDTFLIPLYGSRGGPLRCPLCAGKWNAQHTRRRKWARIVVMAMKMLEKEGGRLFGGGQLDRLRLAALGMAGLVGYDDIIDAEAPTLTSELLADLLRLTHPDCHPAERRDLAHKVTQELLALKPFTFPKPEPEPEPEPDGDASFEVSFRTAREPLQQYPCALCRDEAPMDYCNMCRAEWEKRQDEERERERVKQRKWYEQRKQRRISLRKQTKCPSCGAEIDKSRRKDAKYCSGTCRQRAHRLNGNG